MANRLFVLVVFILADFILGIAVAIKDGTFEFKKTANFLKTYAPNVVVWFVFELLFIGLLYSPEEIKSYLPEKLLEISPIGIVGITVLSAFGSIAGHIRSLGIDIPVLDKFGLPATPQQSVSLPVFPRCDSTYKKPSLLWWRGDSPLRVVGPATKHVYGFLPGDDMRLWKWVDDNDLKAVMTAGEGKFSFIIPGSE